LAASKGKLWKKNIENYAASHFSSFGGVHQPPPVLTQTLLHQNLAPVNVAATVVILNSTVQGASAATSGNVPPILIAAILAIYMQ
jgi:hypothetical protein